MDYFSGLDNAMIHKIIYAIKRALYLTYIFTLYKILYPLTYKLAAGKPVDNRKIVFIEIHKAELSDNFALMIAKLKTMNKYDITVYCPDYNHINRPQRIKRSLHCIRLIATAAYVFLDDTTDIADTVPIRKETTVTQLWHACGAFKRFGYSTASSIFGENSRTLKRYPSHRNYAYVTVSSPDIAWAYEEAMNMPKSSGKVVPTGVSRTDVFFNDEFKNNANKKVRSLIPNLNGRKIILYAPTFRGHVKTAYSPDKLDIPLMREKLRDKYVLLIKNHPFIKKPSEIPSDCRDFCIDVTQKAQIEELLCSVDICISDYSSLIFEYSLFERPMLFYAFDLEDYNDWRGFYYDYDSLTPGEVFTTTEAMIDYIADIDNKFNVEIVRNFRQKFMQSCDGHATDRIIKLVFNDE